MTGLFFDIDDTLYSRRALLLRAARDICPGTTAACDPATICGTPGSAQEDRFMDIFYMYGDENYPLVVTGEITPWESNVWRFVKTLRHLGADAAREDGEAFADHYTYLQEHMEMSDELHKTLRDLSACSAVRLGVITNGASKFQWKKYWTLGLDKYIPESAVIVSGDLAISKPEPGIFRAGEDIFGLSPKDLWMVGDSVKHDIRGAKMCGWHTLWLRRGTEDESTVETDLTAHDEEQLCSLLRRFIR